MTISRVWGVINTVETLPFYQHGEKWYFDPPEDDGTYVCEFWAEDEYGNIGYNAAILTVVEGAVKCIRPLSERYHSLMLADPYRVTASCVRRYTSAPLAFCISAELQPLNRFAIVPKTLNCSRNMQSA